MKLLHVVGARPNLPKLAPVHRACAAAGIEQVVVHTGQHYDDAMSAGFFRDFGIAPPDVNLAVGSETHAVQTARIIERIEPVIRDQRPDWMVVYGDVMTSRALGRSRACSRRSRASGRWCSRRIRVRTTASPRRGSH